MAKQYTTKSDHGYFFISVKQGVETCDISYVRYNLAWSISRAGGLFGSIFFLANLFLRPFVMFKYDISLMRRLYYEEREPSSNEAEE